MNIYIFLPPPRYYVTMFVIVVDNVGSCVLNWQSILCTITKPSAIDLFPAAGSGDEIKVISSGSHDIRC